MTVKRFAIRMAPGMYSKGPSTLAVPIQKAKLWTNIGHVKTHLSSGQRDYPKGAKVISVEMTYIEEELCSVEEMKQENKARRKKKDEESDLRYARLELESARTALARAEARARSKKIL